MTGGLIHEYRSLAVIVVGLWIQLAFTMAVEGGDDLAGL